MTHNSETGASGGEIKVSVQQRWAENLPAQQKAVRESQCATNKEPQTCLEE